MRLQDGITTISSFVRKKAKSLLKSEAFESLKDFGDGFEAFIVVEGGFLLPQIILDDGDVVDYECQCRGSRNRRICLHIAAVMLGVEKMLQAGCDDYHEAVMKLEQRATE
jgi:hypothetical protein